MQASVFGIRSIAAISLVKLFDSGFDCGADHAVAKILLAGYLNALQC